MAKPSSDDNSPSYYYEISNSTGDHFVGEVTDKRKTKSGILGFLRKTTGGVMEPSDSAPDYQKSAFEKTTGNRWKIKVEKADYTDQDCGNEELGEHDDGYHDLGEEEGGEPDDGVGKGGGLFLGWLGWGS